MQVRETECPQHLTAADGHPVRALAQSTAMRPFLDRLDAGKAAAYTATYDDALRVAYPPLPDASALFPFRRLFLVLTCPH